MARTLPFRLSAGLFDLAIAAFAAVAIAFAGFALPEWRLYQLLQLTGLPDILAAAQPPLGLKARLGSAALLGAFTFAAVYLLMRALDRLPSRRRDSEDEDGTIDAASLPIRLRRADAHPDNPARRPLIAGRELGEPFDELLLEAPAAGIAPNDAIDPVQAVDPVQAAEAIEPPVAPMSGPLPSFLVPEEAPPVATPRRKEMIDFLEQGPPPPRVAKPRLAASPVFARVDRDPPSQTAPAAKPQAAAPVVAPTPRVETPAPAPSAAEAPLEAEVAPAPARAAEAPPRIEIAPAAEAPPKGEAAPAPAPAASAPPRVEIAPALPAATAPPKIEFVPAAAVQAAAKAEFVPVTPPAADAAGQAESAGEESISDLMARLETGLRRREQAPSASPGSPAPRADDKIAERLRSAMTDLQKLAARS